MNSTTAATSCLTPVLAGLFRARAGQVSLTLVDIAGNTDLDPTHCRVRDITVSPSVPVPNDSLTAKEWRFTLAARRNYSVQLVVVQIPAIGSRAHLAACGSNLMVIDDTNQIERWTVLS